jgi:hypothetical protein
MDSCWGEFEFAGAGRLVDDACRPAARATTTTTTTDQATTTTRGGKNSREGRKCSAAAPEHPLIVNMDAHYRPAAAKAVAKRAAFDHLDSSDEESHRKKPPPKEGRNCGLSDSGSN